MRFCRQPRSQAEPQPAHFPRLDFNGIDGTAIVAGLVQFSPIMIDCCYLSRRALDSVYHAYPSPPDDSLRGSAYCALTDMRQVGAYLALLTPRLSLSMEAFINKNEHRMKFLKLFAGLRKMREFERLQLPFIKSLTDFDIIIEIGYAQEQKRAFTPKQLSKVGSVTTVRRRLVKLTEQGVVARSTNVNDHRSDLLTLTASSVKLLERYGRMLSGIGQFTKDIAAAAK